jgi:hypothetical protein
MTRQEAIERLKSIKSLADKYDDVMALREAIKALEQEPSGDLINRDMALEKMADYVASGYANSVEDFEEYSRIICQLPSINPQEPKTGCWILHTDASGNSWHACPACGHIAYTLTRFCPDCGARLEAPS